MRLHALSAFVLTSAVLMTGAPAFAQSHEALARTRIAAIAAGSVNTVLSAYAPDADLQWVGGPLDGHYDDPVELRDVWSRFAGLGPLSANIAAMTIAENLAGATVTVDVTFEGKQAIPVRYVLLYRAGLLVDEIWQVNPPHAH